MTLDSNQIVVFNSADGLTSFNVNIFDESVWLTQKQISELFETTIPNVNIHIKSIFESKELTEKAVIKDFLITASDGKKYRTKHYSLDMILSIGYRVQSKRATQFRIWANEVLKQYLLNGYAVNEHRIKKIETKMDALVESNKLLKEDVDGIKNLLLKLIDRPINIYNHIQVGSDRLENKLIETLEHIINNLASEKIKQDLMDVKNSIPDSKTNPKAMNKLKKFFQDIGDSDSETNKALKGAGITKSILAELVKMLKELL